MKASINNKSRNKIDEEEILSLIEFFSKTYELENKEISIAIIGDKVMRRLNHEYREIDKPTDILSFLGEDDFFGELIIDYNQIKRQAPYFSKKLNEELLFIIIHGLLHLLGYNDEKDEDRVVMMDKGKKILKRFFDR